MAPDIQIPTTHSALTFTRRGDPLDVLTITHDFPTPTPSSLVPGEALIKVSAVSTDAGISLIIRSIPHLTSKPWIPEINFAGTIVAMGTPSSDDSNDLRIGDEVIGVRSSPLSKYNGAMQSYLVSPVNMLIRKPKSISMIEASGLPATGCTAIQALELAGVKRGDKVLVTGGSGGLGNMCVQLARVLVGESGIVVSTCSAQNAELVKSLGADETIDYRVHNPLHEYLNKHHSSAPFNAILDVAGNPKEMFTSSPNYLTKSGTFVILGNMKALESASLFGLISEILLVQLNRFLPVFLGGTPRKCLFYSATPLKKDMQRVCDMVEAGQVKSLVDSVWKFEDVTKAYERGLSQRAKGKIIVTFD
ncbi:zinc ion binding [Exophiala oligosperma]